MVAEEVTREYVPTIGIECHIQLKTKTKLFDGVGNDAREAAPNTLISHISTGMPGALPVLNEAAVQLAVRAAFALGVEPQRSSYFERKHYFYPDLPMGYQISQLHSPIIVGGQVPITVNGQLLVVRINRAQLEADAGKNTHLDGADYSLVDLNRAGTPLLEIVSEPDMHSVEEAKAYVRELYLLMKSAQVSDCDLYHGNMRFDVNVSISNHKTALGTRSEVKNLNSFKSVEGAIHYEIERQTALIASGENVIQETRGWDEANQKTTIQRDKEDAHDYRYFPDPDLPPIKLSDAFIINAKSDLPKRWPAEWRSELNKLGIDPSATEVLLDGWVDNPNLQVLTLIEDSRDDTELARRIANWAVNIEYPFYKENLGASVLTLNERKKLYSALNTMVSEATISSTNIKKLLQDIFGLGEVPDTLEQYVIDKGYAQVSNTSAIDSIVAEVLAENEKAAQDVKNGEMKAIGFLVGQVMKKSKGQANPGVAQERIKQKLGI